MINLRPLSVKDAPAVYQALDSSRDALRRWMVWCRADYKLSDAEAFIQRAIDIAAAGNGFHFAMVDATGKVIGVISVEDVNSESRRAMLGYWMATGATGRGLGRQAVAQAIAWARRQPNIETLWAIVADANIASQRVLEINEFHQVASRGPEERGDQQLVYELELRSRSTP